MGSQKQNADPNPYAPPQTESFAEVPISSLDTLKEIGPIRYSGTPGEEALCQYLRTHEYVSGCYLLAVGVTVTLVLLPLALMMSGVLLAVGGFGLVVIVLTVSTMYYRRRVFESINPRWNELTEGTLSADGVRIDRNGSVAFFRWDWYGSAVIGDQVVALLPATQAASPLLITAKMLVKLDDWSRLLQVAGAIGIVSNEASIDDLLRKKNLRLLRQADRLRSVQPPAGAILFEGSLDGNDFQRVPGRYRSRERPVRWYAVVTGLIFFGSLVLIAISQAVFQQMAFLPVFLAFYLVLAGIGLALRTRNRGNIRSSPRYYLKAFATDTSLVTDFAIATTEVDWSQLRLVLQAKDVVVLRRREWIQFVVARRDMFTSNEDWQRFNELVNNR